ncbi:MAG: hypothetical protein HYT80_05880 [Euryarchaeota archaeon]|nr:hypothetical protein [Euryarchaeota archaeon]
MDEPTRPPVDWDVTPEATTKGSDARDVLLIVLIGASIAALLLLAAWLLPLFLDNVLFGPGSPER